MVVGGGEKGRAGEGYKKERPVRGVYISLSLIWLIVVGLCGSLLLHRVDRQADYPYP